MPAFCTVLNCNDKYGHAESISFHKFPFKRKDLFQQWLNFTERDVGWQPSKWSTICSRHFHDEDFNCIKERKTLKKTAVPSLREETIVTTQPTKQPTQPTKQQSQQLQPKKQQPQQLQPPKQQHQQQQSPKQQHQQLQSQSKDPLLQPSTAAVPDKGTEQLAKFNCRLCSNMSNVGVASFADNFEVYGMIQKCFPTLNIQQDDNLPKGMCHTCHQRLDSFAKFIDQVLAAQSELTRKFRSSDKPSGFGAGPVVGARALERQQLKIKQEPVVRVKQEVSEVFESFLSEELDMTVDDADTTAACGASGVNEVDQKYQLCDFPMLNTQDIIDNCEIMEIINLEDPFIDIPDDDGATSAEPFKQHLPSAYDLLQTHLLNEEHNYAYAPEEFKEEGQPRHAYKTEKADEGDAGLTADDAYQQTTAVNDMPIVTSVSAVSTVSTPTPKPKPNIVVLNESIVRSATSGFQLHACTHCLSKFFSAESLSQHWLQQHSHTTHELAGQFAAPPMVSVPTQNLQLQPHQQLQPQQLCKQEFCGDRATPPSSAQLAPPVLERQRIDILEMQQSFVPSYAQPQPQPPPWPEQVTTTAEEPMPPVGGTEEQRRRPKSRLREHYTRLRRRYVQLREKCRSLARCSAKAPRKRHLACSRCGKLFAHIKQLLRHKQLNAATHMVRQPPHTFAATCVGCERFFRSKLALRNHMRYICQMLPLRCFLRAPTTFKCRHCRRITFTHWRLCRRHELMCRPKMRQAQSLSRGKQRRLSKSTPTKRPLVKRAPRVKPLPAAKTTADSKPAKPSGSWPKRRNCEVCGKVFPNGNSLHQHSITHTEARNHKCSLCKRQFKRRNGLMQHMRGYHMQLKPYECGVCKWRYALKCDMKRCRHSQRKRTAS